MSRCHTARVQEGHDVPQQGQDFTPQGHDGDMHGRGSAAWDRCGHGLGWTTHDLSAERVYLTFGWVECRHASSILPYVNQLDIASSV